MTTLSIVGRALSGALASCALAGGAIAQDAWLAGRALFNTHCSSCHYHTVAGTGSNKAGADAARISNALATQAAMSGVDLPDPDTDIPKIVSYLSTPRHASLSPASHPFDDTAIGLVSKPQFSFTLTNDGILELDAAGTVTPDVSAGFAFNAAGCDKLAVNPVPGPNSCTVTVEFQPTEVKDYATSFKVNHDGFDGGSRASVSGKGLLNLEITTNGPLTFTALVTTPPTSDTKTVTIANRLDSSLELCLAAATGDSAQFSAPEDFAMVDRTLASGCVTVTDAELDAALGSQGITFSPTKPGPRFALFTAQRVGTADIQTIELQGNPGPFAQYSGAQLVDNQLFATTRQDINLGATSPPVVLKLTNAGSSPLVVNRSIPRVSGATVDEYFVTGCANGTSVDPGASCDMSLTFDPAAIGLRQTRLVVTYGGRTDEIALRGTGFVGPELNVRDAFGNLVTAIDFGRQNVNVVYPQRLTLVNIGSDEALIVSSASIAGSAFSLRAPSTGGCTALVAGQPQTLAPGGTCLVDVRFAPTQAIAYSGTLSIQSKPQVSATPPPSEDRIGLAGEGANDIPVLRWRDSNGNDVSTLEFPLPPTAVGSATPPRRTVRLANLGPGAAGLRLLNVIGPGAVNFVIDQSPSGSCSFGEQGAPLFQGSTCEVTIVFTPQSAGAKQANLQLVSTGTTPPPIQITAQAAGPAGGSTIVVSPAAVGFEATRVGAQSTPVTVTIANTGSLPATVTGIEADRPFSVQSTTCPSIPFALAPQSSCTANLVFAPSGEGAAAGAMRIRIEDREAPLSASLSGDGEARADLSSGGCSMIEGSSVFDPTLWALGLLAAAALVYRREARRRDQARRSAGSSS